jgi:hypothetical protein
MNIFEFLKYMADNHPWLSLFIIFIIFNSLSSIFSYIFRKENDWKADAEHEKHFWR